MIRDISPSVFQVRQAGKPDSYQIGQLLNFEEYVHRHMDWRAPLDWIGHEPFLVAEQFGRLAGTLTCPPDPIEVAWVRTFGATAIAAPQAVWETLWGAATRTLRQLPGTYYVASVALETWYRQLLEQSGFLHNTDVVLLAWENALHNLPAGQFRGTIRVMTAADLPEVTRIDQAAFDPIWRYSLDGNRLAFDRAVLATVAEDGAGRITGYQISTHSPLGGHLARLAVRPGMQGQGLGYALVRDLLLQFRARGALQVTVNTQADNLPSLQLYQKAHFRPTGESYPIYRFDL